MRQTNPSVLLFDLETSPLLGYAWGYYKTDLIEVVRDSFILCVSYRWLGEDDIYTISLPEFPRFKHNRTDDYFLVKAFLERLNKADIIIAHNGGSFDWKVMNTRLLVHGFDPPNPSKLVDTLKEARRYFRFTSNRQDQIARQLGVKRKEKTEGKHTWFECMKGNKHAWKTMIKYNKGDVRQLSEIYFKERPWIRNHPNYNLYSKEGERIKCPACGSENVRRHGTMPLTAGVYVRWECMNCGKPTIRGEKVDYKILLK